MAKKNKVRESDESAIKASDKSAIKASRSLKLPARLNEEFYGIRNFKFFDNWFFSKFYHAFYSLAVAYSIKKISESGEIPNIDEFQFRDSEQLINSIASEQLANHDDLFKIIAYWYLMKKGDPAPYKILLDVDLARQICEGIFNENWEEYYKQMKDYNSEFPNVQVVDLIMTDTDNQNE